MWRDGLIFSKHLYVAYDVGRGRILFDSCSVTLDFPVLNTMTMIDQGVYMSALTASGADARWWNYHLTLCYVFSLCISTMYIPCRQAPILLLLRGKKAWIGGWEDDEEDSRYHDDYCDLCHPW